VHAGGSLFKAQEIKRAVQTGQAQVGEVLMSLLENENPVFGAGRRAVRGHRLRCLVETVAGAAPGRREILAAQGIKLLYAVAWPAAGHLYEEAIELRGRHEGPQVARLQPGHDAGSRRWSALSP